jgi:hypothetical protein
MGKKNLAIHFYKERESEGLRIRDIKITQRELRVYLIQE